MGTSTAAAMLPLGRPASFHALPIVWKMDELSSEASVVATVLLTPPVGCLSAKSVVLNVALKIGPWERGVVKIGLPDSTKASWREMALTEEFHQLPAISG